MKIYELYRKVCKLGFEDGLEDVDIFYDALSRAAMQVFSARPAVGSCSVAHFMPENTANPIFTDTVTAQGETVVSSSGAVAYSFEVCGIGTALVEARSAGIWENVCTVSFDTGRLFEAFRGFTDENRTPRASRETRIRFLSDSPCQIRGVGLYRSVPGASVDDIPKFARYVAYDMKTLAPDFFRFSASPVLREDQTEPEDYFIEGSVLFLPYEKAGVYRIRYQKAPGRFENVNGPEADERDLGLCEDLCEAVALLTAYYVWLDDEDELAEKYLALYRNYIADIKTNDRAIKPVCYKKECV